MRIHTLAAVGLAGALGSASLAACALDVPDLNNPSLDDLKNHPDAIKIGAACTGLLIGNRGNMAAEGGYVTVLGILGREAYNFDAADPRYVGEMLVGELSRGSPFGGNFWAGPYANLQLATIVLGALDKVSDLSDGDKAGVRGFTQTIEALDFLEVVVTHDSNGAVLDINPDPLAPLSPIVRDTKVEYRRITDLLDAAALDLANPDAGFPFALSKGFANFDTPATFRQFNRAIRARVAAYTGDYATVLDVLNVKKESFLNDDPATLDVNAGVYHAYSTKPGDAGNALINPNIFAHPSIELTAAHDAMNNPIDARLLRKTQATDPPTSPRATEGLALPAPAKALPVLNFKKLYPNPEASVALIRNEELILLEAEAQWFTGDHGGAVTTLNKVRTLSGKLPALVPAAVTSDDMFVTELLYDRRYSLLFEGHRWIDVRRLGKLSTLPIFNTTNKDGTMTPDTLNIRFPIPLAECNARPGEFACTLGSTGG